VKVIKYGVTLSRITENDIEMIRQWRNSSHVADRMEYREPITPEMQKQWFRKIDNLDNYFYLIEYDGEKIGLISERKRETADDTTESGLFLADPKYFDSFAPVLASLMMIETSFYLLNGKDSYIRIMRDNIKAIRYNTSLGYELCEGQENVQNQQYILTRAGFEQRTAKIRKAALQLSGNDPNMYLVLEPEDFEKGVGQFWEKITLSNSRIFSKPDGENKVYYWQL
jgi:UDP-4-amino-4,6-dideoxy-N-acetyl-beta-L-altrosamine N-acetyltransferase